MIKKLLPLLIAATVATGAYAQDKSKTSGNDTHAKTTHGTPLRDPKTGKFMKGTAHVTTKAKSGKVTAKSVKGWKVADGRLRDPKTGRFIKGPAKPTLTKVKAKAATGHVTAKKMPARDPKTGRFIKTEPGKAKSGH